jgi:hypothetical protein
MRADRIRRLGECTGTALSAFAIAAFFLIVLWPLFLAEMNVPTLGLFAALALLALRALDLL